MIRTFFFSIACIFLYSCSQPYDHTSFKQQQTQPSQEKEVHPIQADLLKKLNNATHIRDVLHFSDVTILSNLDPFGFANLSKALLIDQKWALFDAYTQSIILADEHGEAYKKVGTSGQGPGEYERVSDMFRIWGDHIGVMNVGKIDIFDKYGEWVKEILVQVGSEQYHTRTYLSWNNPERLFIADFPSHTRGIPAHGIFLYDGQSFQKHRAFGKRFYETLEKRNGMPFLTMCFQEIDETLWTSNPYRSEFEVYSSDGELLKTLPIFHADTRTEEDFRSITSRDEFFSIMGETFGGTEVRKVGPLIFAFYLRTAERYCNVYDTSGTLLKRHLTCHIGMISATDAVENTLYYKSNSASNLSSWRKYLSEDELETLNQQGIDTNITDGPIFIIAATIDENPQP